MVTKEDAKKIVELYEKGLSSIQIAKKFNRSSSGIRLILRKSNIEIRNKAEANKLSSSVKRNKEHHRWKNGFSFHKGQVYRNLNHKRVKESHYQWCIANFLSRIPVGMIIHHIDCNPKNNNPKNLVLLDQSTYVKLHRAIGDNRMLKILDRGG